MEFEDLYQEVILDHYRHPRNFGQGHNGCISVEHDNPVCGDHIRLMLDVDESGVIRDVKFEGEGCAISMASASMMTEAVIGKKESEAREIIDSIVQIMRGDSDPENLENYGDLAALKGVVKFPVRVKCATLAWHALENAMSQK